jgi:ASPM-SPD-2-Hydin domain-containing protein
MNSHSKCVLFLLCLLTGCGGNSGPNTAPSANLSANSLTFGSEDVGSTSAPFPVTLTNSGTASLNILQIAVTQDFSQSNDCKMSLAPQGSCTINVTLTPTSSGSLTGTLTVTDNDASGSQSASLSGTGLPAASGGRCSAQGMECPAQFPPCCPGLVCAPASTRAFCEPASASSSEMIDLLRRDEQRSKKPRIDLDTR